MKKSVLTEYEETAAVCVAAVVFIDAVLGKERGRKVKPRRIYAAGGNCRVG